MKDIIRVKISPVLLLLPLTLISGCGARPRYEKVNSIPNVVEISFEAPKEWSRHLDPAGSAKDSWAIEILHPQNRLIRIDIKKYAEDPSLKGYPLSTASRLLGDARELRNAQVSEPRACGGKTLAMRCFTVTADYIEASGGARAPRMKDSYAYFESGGFLYVVDYAAPERDHETALPVFRRMLETLELTGAAGKPEAQ